MVLNGNYEYVTSANPNGIKITILREQNTHKKIRVLFDQVTNQLMEIK